MSAAAQDIERALERLARLFERARELEIARAPVDSDLALRDPVIDLCSALVHQRLIPAFAGSGEAAQSMRAWLESDPVHLTVLGSTNTGKSTVLNALLGRAASGMRVTARYSQHPEAWASPEVAARFERYPGRFPGYARYAGEAAPRQSDADIEAHGWRPALAVRDLGRAAPLADSAGEGAMLWDAPDVSTEEAKAWLPAVIDTLALAEVCLYVVTHESYADDRGLALFTLARRTAAVADVCANKVGAGSELVADIQRKLSASAQGSAGAGSTVVYPLPWVDGQDPDQRLERVVASPEARALRAAIRDRLRPDAGSGRRLKLDALERSARFVEASFESALEPLRAEARVADRWAALVQRTTRRELVEAYAAEYLETRRYQEFSDALLELMRLLEVPGIGPVLAGIGKLARLPVGLLKKAWSSVTARVGERRAGDPGESEQQIVARLFRAWLAALKAEAQTLARAESHPAWTRIADEVQSARVVDELVAGFERAYRQYRALVDERVAESARTIYAKIAESPKLLNSLRAANLVGDAGVTISAVAAGGLSPTDLLLGPLVHGLWEELVERGLGGFVRRQEELLKSWQEERVGELFEGELAVRARALFVGAFDPAELDQGRRDLGTLVRAVELAVRQLSGEIGKDR